MRRLLLVVVALVAFGFATPASAVRVEDPIGVLSDPEGNKGYVEVAPNDGSGAVLRVCNEHEHNIDQNLLPPTVLGGGYLWVNPNGEDTPVMYGNENVGTGDDDEASTRDCPTEGSAPTSAVKVEDPVGVLSDPQGKRGYVEVASNDGSDALLRVCNEHDFNIDQTFLPPTVLGGGYLWVNPNGEDTPVMYGNENVGTGDDDEASTRDCPTEGTTPASVVKVEDPVGVLSDPQGNKGYVEVVSNEGALLRVCNEHAFKVPLIPRDTVLAGGYLWVHPSGENNAEAIYGNQRVGTGDASPGTARDCP